MKAEYPKFSIFILYYNQPEALTRQLEAIKDYKERIRISIIDDGSRQYPIEDLLNIIPTDVRVYKILNDKKWNIPGARNLSVKLSESDWLIQLDIDQILTNEKITKLLNIRLTKDCYYLFNRSFGSYTKPTTGTMLINRKYFIAAGGYDESFAGYYGYNDPYLKWKLKLIGIREVLLNDVFVEDHSIECSTPLVRNFRLRNRIKFLFRRLLRIMGTGRQLRFDWIRIQ